MRAIALFVLLLAAAEAQTVRNRRQSEFTCIQGGSDIRDASQVIRMECGAEIASGSSGVAVLDWSSILRDTTRLQDTKMLVDSIPDTLGAGQELVSLHSAFTANGRQLPTCQSKRRAIIEFNRTSEVQLEPTAYNPNGANNRRQRGANSRPQAWEAPRAAATVMDTVYDEWDSPEGEEDAELAAFTETTKHCKTHGTPPPPEEKLPDVVDPPKKDYYGYDSEGYSGYSEKDSEYSEYYQGDSGYDSEAGYDSEEESSYADGYTAAISAAGTQQNRKIVRPTGLRVLVKCKGVRASPTAPPSGGSCSVRLRVTLRTTGGVIQFPQGSFPTQAVDNLVARDQYTCRTLTFQDFTNVLSTTELNGDEGPAVDTQLCLPETTPAAGAPTIPAGAPWDEVSLDRAVRFSRYASALHGCLPGQDRTWEDVASWGGPTPGPECRSCFKDGINYGPGSGGPPAGWQTENIPGRSYIDAAVVTTDTDVDPLADSIVVTFRATVTGLNRWQWLSNLGSCMLLARFIRSPVRDSAGTANPAAGDVCEGWARAVDLLYADILLDVRQRIAALSGPGGTTNARIFVTGHSRGAALASYFAARLLLEQDLGSLGTYTGPFGRRGQISLYTFGGPRVGDATFAGFLEQRMYERFRVINRLDPVTAGPFRSWGYEHVRPAVWFREANALGGLAPLPNLQYQWCVMTPAAQLSLALNACFDSCNSAVVCSNVDVPPGVAVAGTRVPADAACQNILDTSLEGGLQINTFVRGRY